MDPFITTYTDRVVNPLKIDPDSVAIWDIAHALALCNRFAGHSCRPISVAQHSLHVSLLSEPFGLQGLLHDASEAYLGDMTKWLKETNAMAPYREAEDRALRVILMKFGCFGISGDGKAPQHPTYRVLSTVVMEADKLMVRYEHEQAFGHELHVEGYGALTKGERKRIQNWSFMTWQDAESAFLARFRDLTRK